MEFQNEVQDLRRQRLSYNITQEMLASCIGISRAHLVKVENGKENPSKELVEAIRECLNRYDPDNPVEIVFDYCRIRFPTTDAVEVIKNIMRLNTDYMLYQEYAFYGYASQYVLGNVVVMVSPDEEKGTLLELKGQGCRQFEVYLAAQNRTWYDFLKEVVEFGGVFKRVDIAINDKFGFLSIPMLIKKCEGHEIISVFRHWDKRGCGELIRSREENKKEMGNTLYLGSMKSEVYFCIYEKDYEQYVRNGVLPEDAEVKNRFEIRLKNERAEIAIKDFMKWGDIGNTAFGIINRYVCFLDKEEGKRKEFWKVNKQWANFLENKERKLRLTTKPEPYTFRKTLNWLSRQVAPTWKVVEEIDKRNNTSVLSSMVEGVKLCKHHEMLIKQQTASVKDLIV